MAWAYKGTLTIDHTQCGGADSSAFPVCVRITDTTLKTTAHSGQINNTVTQTGGNAVTMPADLIFTSDSAGATKIAWEFESYDGTNGVIVAWVQVATLSHSADTVLYMFYGDATVTTQQNTSSYAPSAVWDSNYKAVYHLADGATLRLSDSTSQGNTLVNNSSNVTAAAGLIDGGASFAADTVFTFLSCASPSGIPVGTSARTISAWLKGWSTPAGYTGIMYTSADTGAGAMFNMGLNADNSLFFWGDSANVGYPTGVAMSAAVWNFAVITYDGTTVSLSVNAGTALTGTPSLNSGAAHIVIQAANGSSSYFNGIADEVRISSIVRPAAWILSEYNNQKSSSTFLSASLAPVSSGTTVTPGYAALALTEYAPKLKLSVNVPLATLAISGKAPSLKLGVPVPLATLAITPHAASLKLTVPVPKASLTTTAYAPKLGLAVPVPKASLSITGHAVALKLQIPVGLGVLSLSTYAPLVSIGTVLQPGYAQLAIAGYSPALGLAVRVPKAALSITGKAPSLNLNVPVGFVALAIDGQVPSVDITHGTTVTPGYSQILIAGFDPTVIQTTNAWLTPGAAALRMAGFPPFIGMTAGPTFCWRGEEEINQWRGEQDINQWRGEWTPCQ